MIVMIIITKEEKVDTEREVIEEVCLTNYPINMQQEDIVEQDQDQGRYEGKEIEAEANQVQVGIEEIVEDEYDFIVINCKLNNYM